MQLISVPVIPSSVDAQWTRPELGSFSAKKLLVLSAPFAAEGPEAATLSRMLKACHLETQDYTLLFFDEAAPYSWAALQSAGMAPVVLLLGVSPESLQMKAWFQLCKVQDFCGTRLIPAPSLAMVEQDASIKRKLWEEGLKPALLP